jgi:hypothetical protein
VAVDPAISSGLPLPAVNRRPPPGSRPEKYSTPATKGSPSSFFVHMARFFFLLADPHVSYSQRLTRRKTHTGNGTFAVLTHSSLSLHSQSYPLSLFSTQVPPQSKSFRMSLLIGSADFLHPSLNAHPSHISADLQRHRAPTLPLYLPRPRSNLTFRKPLVSSTQPARRIPRRHFRRPHRLPTSVGFPSVPRMHLMIRIRTSPWS